METLARPGEHVATNPPAVAFTVIGNCGLGLSWRAADQVLAASRAIGEWLIAVGVMLFIVLSALYAIKTVHDSGIVAAEFRDRSQLGQRAMAMVAAAITVERLAPAGERVARVIGAVIIGTGLFLIARTAGLA